MIDTHCHLWFKHFNGEVPAVIERAKNAGVHTLICVGCNEESSRQSVEIAGQYENVYAAVGVHPTELLSSRAEARRGGLKSRDLAFWLPEVIKSSKKIIGIGETGIDFYHEPSRCEKCVPERSDLRSRERSEGQRSKNLFSNFYGAEHFPSPVDADLQKTMFREHCLLAQEFDLPVIVHLRSGKHAKEAGQQFTAAEKACLEVLDHVVAQTGKNTAPLKVLFHCFSSDRRFAEEVLSRGWYLSFSGVITYPNATELREVVKMCPLDRMVVETDSPFLAPKSHRGERNEPAFVVETARQIAELKRISYEELEKHVDQNVRRLMVL